MEYSQTSYRYIVCTTYIIAALINSLPIHTFSSINKVVSIKFDQDPSLITFNALVFTIAHPLFAFPCNWFLRRFGMHLSFILGGTLVIAGAWLRLLLQHSAFYCLGGSTLCAIGNIFVLNSPSKMALNWFRVDLVPLITFVAVLCNLVSITVGASLPGLILSQKSSKTDILQFLKYQAAAITAGYILLALLFRDKPKSPPSKAASQTKVINYKALLKELFTNVEYIKLAVILALNYGTITAFISTLDQLLQGFEFSNSGQTAAYSIITAMGAGIVGNIVLSVVLKKTKMYKKSTILCSLISFLCFTGLNLLYYLKIESMSYIIPVAAISGFFLIPVPSLVISFASEVVFPLDQASSAGYLFAVSQTFAAILGFIFSQILKTGKDGAIALVITSIVLMFASFLMSLFSKQQLNRQKYENGHSEQTPIMNGQPKYNLQ